MLRFTDASYDEIKKAGTAASGGCDAGLLRDTQNAMRHDRMLNYNLDARILQDVLSPMRAACLWHSSTARNTTTRKFSPSIRTERRR